MKMARGGTCYDSIAAYIFTDNCFSFTSTLADALRSMDVSRDLWTCLSRTPVSRVTCHRLVYSYVPVPVLRVSYCTNVDRRLVPGHLSISRFSICIGDSFLVTRLFPVFSFCVIDLSAVSLFLDSDSFAYISRLCLSFSRLSTHLSSRYLWTLTRY